MLQNMQMGQPLTKKEMKQVLGGTGTGGSCCAHITTGSCPDCGGSHWHCGLSKQEAKDKAVGLAMWLQDMAADNPGIGYEGLHAYWCCASCP